MGQGTKDNVAFCIFPEEWHSFHKPRTPVQGPRPEDKWKPHTVGLNIYEL